MKNEVERKRMWKSEEQRGQTQNKYLPLFATNNSTSLSDYWEAHLTKNVGYLAHYHFVSPLEFCGKSHCL